MKRFRFLSLLLLVACALVCRAGAGTVSAGSTDELVAALETAAVDVIVLQSNTVYTLARAHNFWHGPNGLPPITRPITIEGRGAMIERSPDPATPPFRFFFVSGGRQHHPPAGALTLRNLVLRGGLIKGGDGADGGGGGAGLGGAILNQGTVTLEGVAILHNAARGGAGGQSADFTGGGGGTGGNGGIGSTFGGGGGGGFGGRGGAGANGGGGGGGFGGHGGDGFYGGGGGGGFGSNGGNGHSSGGGGGGFSTNGMDGSFEAGGSGSDGAHGGRAGVDSFSGESGEPGASPIEGGGGGGGRGGSASEGNGGHGGPGGRGGQNGGGGGGGSAGGADELGVIGNGGRGAAGGPGGGGGGGGSGGDIHRSSTDSSSGGDGGFGGGGGGGGLSDNRNFAQPDFGRGGDGGPGGGGGGAGAGIGNGRGGDGGFGGGGGKGLQSRGGNGGFGAGGGASALGPGGAGGFGGGGGESATRGGGGGGAGFGGGIFNDGGIVYAVNSTIAANSSFGGLGGGAATAGAGLGGALFNFGGSITFQHVTVSHNTNGGVYNLGISNAARCAFSNSIVANSVGLVDVTNNGGAILGRRNLIESSGGVPPSVVFLVADPQLGNLQFTAGSAPALPLLPGSPAIDAGENAGAAGLPFDQRGPGFLRVIGGRPDLGAFEVQETGSPQPCAPAVAVDAAGAEGAIIHYRVPVIPGGPRLVCSPRTGRLFAIGVHRIACVPEHPTMGEGRCEFTIIVRGPRGIMRHVKSVLAVHLREMRNTERPPLRAAIARVDASLLRQHWLDGQHLSAAGAAMFANTKIISRDLLALSNRYRHARLGFTLESSLRRVVAADRLLAEIAVGEAAAPSSAALAAMANWHLAAGDAQFRNRQYLAAIEHYEMAWRRAVSAR